MKKIIENIISPEEAEQMRIDFPPKFFMFIEEYEKDPFSQGANKVLAAIKSELGCVLPKSYLKAEGNGLYDWHVDTGNNNHMPWCTHGCSLLLSKDFEGGMLEYRDGSSFKRPLDLMIHTRDVEHRVTETTSGDRHVFLLFLRIGVGMI
jgi:hypothetical protein